MVSRDSVRGGRSVGTRILGVDPGTRNVGWGVIDVQGSRVAAVAYGTLRAKSSGTLAERLLVLGRGLREVIADHRPHEAAIEEAFYGRDVRSALRIGEARGALHLVLAESGLEVAGYSNNVIKKSVTGVGRAAKEQVQAMVRRILQLDGPVASADAADALAIAVCHHQRRGLQLESGTPKRVRDAIRRQDHRP